MVIGHWLVALVFASVVLGCGTPDGSTCEAALGEPDGIGVLQAREFGGWMRLRFDGFRAGGVTVRIDRTEYGLPAGFRVEYYHSGELVGIQGVYTTNRDVFVPGPTGVLWDEIVIQAETIPAYWLDAVATAGRTWRVFVPVVGAGY